MQFDEAGYRIISDTSLDATDRLVSLAFLHMLAADELGLALPSIATIARATGRSPAEIAHLLWKLWNRPLCES